MKDVMHEAMDIDGLRRVLEGIRDGSIRTIAVDTPVPSQFAHEILNANPYAFLDDAPLEERRARAVQLRRTLPASVLEEAGKLDPAAIAQVIEESRPDLRDPDDLHDLLQTLILFPVRMAVAHIHPQLANVETDKVDESNGCKVGERGNGDAVCECERDERRVPHLRVAPFDAKVGGNTLPSQADCSCGPTRPGWMHQLVETRRAVSAFVRRSRVLGRQRKSQRLFIDICRCILFSRSRPNFCPRTSDARSDSRPRPARLDAAHRTIHHSGTQ